MQRNPPWSEREELVLVRMHQRVSNVWMVIAARLPGRDYTQVKNQFKVAAKRKEPAKYLVREHAGVRVCHDACPWIGSVGAQGPP